MATKTKYVVFSKTIVVDVDENASKDFIIKMAESDLNREIKMGFLNSYDFEPEIIENYD